MRSDKKDLEGQDFYLAILKDLEFTAQNIDDYLLNSEFDDEADDFARLVLWQSILKAIVDNAEEHDMVDTLDLHPLMVNGKEI